MALVNPKEDKQPAPTSKAWPKIESEVFRGITVDTQYVPSSHLLAWVEGSTWTVRYYSQVLDADNQPTPQNLDRDAPYQQYREIKDLDLRVTTPISFNQDPQIRTMEVRGSAITLPFLRPNVGDMFIADIGDGQAGVFTVTSATRNTILKDSVYTIEYEMVDNETQERLGDFERKTIETFYYSRASLQCGCGPLLTDVQVARRQRYAILLQQLLGIYLQDFWSVEQRTLLVPDQRQKTYDHFVVNFLLNLLDTQDHRLIREMRTQNVASAQVMKEPTLWDSILRLDATYLSFSTQKVYLLSRLWFRDRPELRSFAYSGIEWLVYPQEPPTDVESRYDHVDLRPRPGIALREGGTRRQQIPGVERKTAPAPQTERLPPDYHDPDKIPPDFHPVTKDNFYVLSQAFYHDTPLDQSKLEQLTSQILSPKEMNLKQLDYLLEGIFQWPNLERYYYYPLVMALLKVALRTI